MDQVNPEAHGDWHADEEHQRTRRQRGIRVGADQERCREIQGIGCAVREKGDFLTKGSAKETGIVGHLYEIRSPLEKLQIILHRLASSFVLGYHGCDRKVAERVLSGAAFRPSQNDFDWLGHGVYFWEANPARGLEFAREAPRRGHRIANPTVIGAVIDLGLCLDLTTLLGIHHVQAAHGRLVEMAAAAGYDLPQNGPDLLRRNLDCAVIEVLHDIRKDSGETPIDTVRGVFLEGSPIFEGSGFYAKTHIQICVCNPACIKGVFRVPKDQLS